MVAADDHVRTTAILSDESVPNRFARPGHTHGKREESKFRGATWILRQNCLVASDAGEVINVTRLCHSHRRMNQQTRLSLSASAEGQFDMGTMHGIARLECDNPAPALPAKLPTQFRGRQT
jgi:hypothetical protein